MIEAKIFLFINQKKTAEAVCCQLFLQCSVANDHDAGTDDGYDRIRNDRIAGETDQAEHQRADKTAGQAQEYI